MKMPYIASHYFFFFLEGGGGATVDVSGIVHISMYSNAPDKMFFKKMNLFKIHFLIPILLRGCAT